MLANGAGHVSHGGDHRRCPKRSGNGLLHACSSILPIDDSVEIIRMYFLGKFLSVDWLITNTSLNKGIYCTGLLLFIFS